MAYCIHPKPIKTHPLSLSDKFCATILLLKRWSRGLVVGCYFLLIKLQDLQQAANCGVGQVLHQSGRAREFVVFSHTHTTHPPTKATHPKYFLNTAHPKRYTKPISLKYAANGYFDNDNCSNIVLRWMKRYLAEFYLNDTFSRQDLPLVTDDKARQ